MVLSCAWHRYSFGTARLMQLLALGLLALAVLAQGLILRWEPTDDAYISFRYAENLVNGHGLVFNPGQRVEGYTNFLWTIILAGVSWLGLDIPRSATCLSVAMSILALALTWLLARQVGRERGWPPALAWAPPVILACFPGFSYSAFSAMEGPLLSCLILAFLLIGCKHASTGSSLLLAGLLGVLAAMTRWEAVLLWPVVVLVHLCDRSQKMRQNLAQSALLSAVLLIGFGVYFIARFSYYGQLMPNTYYAKIASSLFNRTMTGLAYTGELAISWLLPVTFIAWLSARPQRWTVVLAASLVIYVAYVTWTGGDFFPWLRFYLPILPVAAIMAANTVERLAVVTRQSRINNYLRVAFTLTLAVTVVGIALRIDYPSAQGQQKRIRGWKKVGCWARTAFPTQYRIALAPVGAVGYYSQHPVVDMLGLTDYEVAHFGQTDFSEGPGHQKSYIESILRRKPEIVLGSALIFDHCPTEEETIRGSLRKTLKKMYALPEFQRLYKYEVAHFGQIYIPYWISHDAEQAPN